MVCWGCVMVFWGLHYLMSILVFSIILPRKREFVALFLLPLDCLFTVHFLWLFLTVPSICLQCASVVFPNHTPLLFGVSSI